MDPPRWVTRQLCELGGERVTSGSPPHPAAQPQTPKFRHVHSNILLLFQVFRPLKGRKQNKTKKQNVSCG